METERKAKEKEVNFFFKIFIKSLKFLIKNSFPFLIFYNFTTKLKKADSISKIEGVRRVMLKNTVYMYVSLIPWVFFVYQIFNMYSKLDHSILSNMGSFTYSTNHFLILGRELYPFLFAFLIVSSITILLSIVINFIVSKTHVKVIEENQVRELLLKNKFVTPEEIKDFFVFVSHEGIYLGHENYTQDDILHWKKLWEKLNFKVGSIKLGKKDSNISFYEIKYDLKREINYVFD